MDCDQCIDNPSYVVQVGGSFIGKMFWHSECFVCSVCPAKPEPTPLKAVVFSLCFVLTLQLKLCKEDLALYCGAHFPLNSTEVPIGKRSMKFVLIVSYVIGSTILSLRPTISKFHCIPDATVVPPPFQQESKNLRPSVAAPVLPPANILCYPPYPIPVLAPVTSKPSLPSMGPLEPLLLPTPVSKPICSRPRLPIFEKIAPAPSTPGCVSHLPIHRSFPLALLLPPAPVCTCVMGFSLTLLLANYAEKWSHVLVPLGNT